MTTSLHAAPLGVQTPRVSLVPRVAANDFEDAAFLASSYGLTPDDWQERVLEGWLGIRADRSWAAPRCGLAVPRQNGKNAVVEMRELHGMVTLGERILHTAHEVKTSRKAFLRLLGFFENERHYPELAGLVAEIRKTNGQEAITLRNGGSVEFVSRSKSSGRGFSVDVLVMDEAQELGEEALSALGPTNAASPNPQTILTGTPPGPAANGEVFSRMRADGVEGSSRRLCWQEWSCLSGADLDDKANWALANPALGIRLRYEATADERAAFDDVTFARERLGVWDESSGGQVIGEGAWSTCWDELSTAEDPVAFAVDVTPDRSAGAIGVAGRRSDGLFHVGVHMHAPGVHWIAGEVAALVGKWNPVAVALDPGGPAGALLPDLRAAGIEPVLLGTAEVKQAAGAFYDDVMSVELRHRGTRELWDAVQGAVKRPVGDAWMWDRRAGADICPLVAVTHARHAFAVHGGRVYDLLSSVW